MLILMPKIMVMKNRGIVHVCHCSNCGAEITYVILENHETDVDDDEVTSESNDNK